MELRRGGGIRSGRIQIDDVGVTQVRLWSRSTIAWDDIDGYRLEVRLAPGSHGVFYLVDVLGGVLAARDLRNAMRGRHNLRFGVELTSGDLRLNVDWRFRDATQAVRQILARVADRHAARARAELAASKSVRFGPLALAAHGIQWGDRETLSREAVEAVELFDSSPVALRVMKRGKVMPYGQASTREIPNLCAALDIAAELGYPQRGRELLDPVR